MASELKANLITPASGTALQVGESGDTITLVGTAVGFGGGKVLQCLQSTIKTDTWTSSTNSFVDVTGMSIAITPSSTSSKILILGQAGIHGGDGVTSQTKLVRDSTDICVGAAASNRTRATYNSSNQAGDIDGGNSLPISFLDSPSTTSAVTYKLQARNNGSGGTIYLNRTTDDSDLATRGRFASVIIVQEIGA